MENDRRRPIKINFKKTEVKENESKVYYHECLGSSCCPRDPRWDCLEKGKSTIETFEKEQNVKVIGLHKVILGKEGEHCNYLTLDDLENSQKIVVLNLLKYISKLNKSEEQTSKIFIPNIVYKRNYIIEEQKKQYTTATTDLGILLNGKLVLYLG